MRHNLKTAAKSGGFTLTELLVVVAISGMLAALAAPAFSSIIATQRAKAIGSELYASLTRARSEAIARNATVTLSAKPGGWQNGWQILDPANASHVLDDRNALPGVAVAGPASVAFQGDGRLVASSDPSFVITTSAGSTKLYECVSVALSGRPYMKAAPSC